MYRSHFNKDVSALLTKEISTKAINNIIVATDLNENAKVLIDIAQNFAKQLNADLKVVSCYQDHYNYSQNGNAIKKAVSGAFERLSAMYPETNFEFVSGIPSKVLADMSQTTDLLIVQPGHISGLRESLFHTYSHELYHKSACPVLVVPDSVTTLQTEKLLVFGQEFEFNKPVNPMLFDFATDLEFVYVSDFSNLEPCQQEMMLVKFLVLETNYKRKYPYCNTRMNAVNTPNYSEGVEMCNSSRKFDLLVFQTNKKLKQDKASFIKKIDDLLTGVETPLLLI